MFKGLRIRILLEYQNSGINYKVTGCCGFILPFFLVLSLPHFLMQKGSDSTHIGVPDIQQYDTVMCQLHCVWHHLLHVTGIRCTDRLCRRNSLWEFSLRPVKATKQHISCITVSALRHLCQATSRNVDDLVRCRFTENQTSVIFSVSVVHVNSGLRCSKRKTNNCNTFLLSHAYVMPHDTCKAKFPKQQQQQQVWSQRMLTSLVSVLC